MSATLMLSTLTRCLYVSSIWLRAWPRRRLVPPSIMISVIDITAAVLTAAFLQKLCQALSSANCRCRKGLMVPPRAIVPDDLPALDRDHSTPQQVDDLSVVCCHHHGRTAGVDAQEQLHDLPRRGRGGVACGIVGCD